jgi:3-hydroxybutyryl-CoA dehydratase
VNDDSSLSRDFDRLEVGDEFRTGGRTITESDLVSFAALTGDWHPQHADAAWAARSEFGERIAHGMLVLSFAVGLAPIDPDRVAALRGIDAVTFKRPVRIGDTIHVEGRIEELRPVGEQAGLVTCLWRVVNQAGELAARARVTIVWRRDGLGGPPTNGPAIETPERLFDEVYL